MDFNPVGAMWQRMRAKAVGLQVSLSIPIGHHRTVPLTKPPASNIRIVGDGNCFFRSLSHILIGTEYQYRYLRCVISRFIARNNAIFSDLAGVEDYAVTSGMKWKGTWASEVEIMATATLLATDICVYSPYSRDVRGRDTYKWLTYTAVDDIEPLVQFSKTTAKIYLSNINYHYQPVYQI